MKPFLVLAGVSLALAAAPVRAAEPCAGPWLKPELFAALPQDKQAAELDRLAQGLKQGCSEAFNGLGYLATAVPDDYEGALRWFSLLIKVGETQARQIGVQTALIEQFLKKIGELSSALTEAEKRLAESETRAKALLGEQQRKDAEFAAMTEKLESASAVTSRQRAEIAALSDARARLTRDMDKLREELRAAADQAARTRTQYDEVSSVLTLKIGELEALKTQSGEVSRRLTEALARIGSLDGQVASQKNVIASLNGEKGTLQGFVSDKAIENEDLRKQLARLVTTVAQKSADLTAKTEELRKALAKMRASDARISGLEAALGQERKAHAETKALLSETTRKIGALQADLDKATAVITQKAAELAKAREEIGQLGSALDTARAAHAETKALLSEATGKNGTLQAERDAATTQNGKLKTDLAKAQHEIGQLGSALDAERRAHEGTRAQLSDAMKKAGELAANLNATKAQNGKLEADLAVERQAHAATSKERDDLRKEVEGIRKLVSTFYARLVEELGGKEGISVSGDRFIIQSEVLFDSGSYDLSAEGRAKVERIAAVMQDIAPGIPAELKWVLQINGYTDIKKVKPGSAVRDNWELSTRRALTVLRLLEEKGVASDRLAAAGYGENHPVAAGATPEDLKKNRRIELKLTN